MFRIWVSGIGRQIPISPDANPYPITRIPNANPYPYPYVPITRTQIPIHPSPCLFVCLFVCWLLPFRFKIKHEGPEGWDNMWQKSRAIWKYIDRHYKNDFDWFVLGGDDIFLIVENLRKVR